MQDQTGIIKINSYSVGHSRSVAHRKILADECCIANGEREHLKHLVNPLSWLDIKSVYVLFFRECA